MKSGVLTTVFFVLLAAGCSSDNDGDGTQSGELSIGGAAGTGAGGAGGSTAGGTGGVLDCSDAPQTEEGAEHSKCGNYSSAATCCFGWEVNEYTSEPCLRSYRTKLDDTNRPVDAPEECRQLVDATIDCARAVAMSDCEQFHLFFQAATTVRGEVVETPGAPCFEEARAALDAGCAHGWGILSDYPLPEQNK